jgi:Holliday junction resolvase RusA-like endonuclease
MSEPVISLTIPMLPIGPNGSRGLLRSHWSARSRHRKEWETMIGCALRMQGDFTPAQERAGWNLKRRARVEITQYRPRLLDPDNATAAVKVVLDACRRLGLIYDDAAKWLELSVVQVTDREPRTNIRIEVLT